MERRLFGTDGIRGLANRQPMDAQTVMKVGMAAGCIYTRGDHRHRVVIGKDTRLSGYMLESALTAGFTSVGMDVILFGPLPTPAVAMLVRSLRADLGVMLSASHNSYEDNGVKLFGPDGFKLSDVREREIEALVENGLEDRLAPAREIGRARRIDDAGARYIEFAKATFPRNLRLDGMRIVVDCANGAAYKVAPAVLAELGAEVVPIGVTPDGFNINRECGSTATNAMCQKVLETRADLGIALDGDADRVLISDERGQLVNGDQLMAVVASAWQREGRLSGPGIVSTVMSNLGLERYLESLGLALERTKVGDRYVIEKMRSGGFNLGGEQSGHIILSDYTTTGDGLIAALQILACILTEKKPASEVCAKFAPFPQILRNVRFKPGPGISPMDTDAVKAAIAAAEEQLGNSGRILVRKSGTEPLIRVMGEGENEDMVTQAVESIIDALQAVA